MCAYSASSSCFFGFFLLLLLFFFCLFSFLIVVSFFSLAFLFLFWHKVGKCHFEFCLTISYCFWWLTGIIERSISLVTTFSSFLASLLTREIDLISFFSLLSLVILLMLLLLLLFQETMPRADALWKFFNVFLHVDLISCDFCR